MRVDVPPRGSGWSQELEKAYRLALAVGTTMGIGTPALISGLLLGKVVPPGRGLAPEVVQQVGYLFTGLVFLAASWSFWRSGKVLSRFREVVPGRRPAILLREGILHAALSELSCLLGLAYWMLAGEAAGRHPWGFILLSPLLFLGVVPRKSRWRQSLEG